MRAGERRTRVGERLVEVDIESDMATEAEEEYTGERTEGERSGE
jgi:hypothetical protein